MKKMYLFLAVLAMVAATSLMGCAGKMYVKQTPLDNGYTVIQGGRTGVFGTDNSFFGYIPPTTQSTSGPVAEPQKIPITKTYTKSVTSWTGCPDGKPNKNAKNVKREESSETWTEEQVIQPENPMYPAQPQPILMGWGNASTGNWAAPAVAIGGGMVGAAAVLRPNKYNSETNVNQKGGGASANSEGSNAEINHSANSESNSNSEINHSGNSGRSGNEIVGGNDCP